MPGTFVNIFGDQDSFFEDGSSWQPNFSNGEIKDFTNQKMITSDLAADRQQIPAGYTYFGQFVDHDITRDNTGLSQASHGEAKNLRTPTLDLDSVYSAPPQAFDNSKQRTFKFDTRYEPKYNLPYKDLHRDSNGEAIIGDDRNDENAIVCQLHLAFLLAHNKLVERTGSCDSAKRTLRWLYHWVVLRDFLPKIVNTEVLALALRNPGYVNQGPFARLKDDDMPAEFSYAAYRFGHTMVRDSYKTNSSPFLGSNDSVVLFDNDTREDLTGGRPLGPRQVVQWDQFLQMKSSKGEFPQKAMPLDTKLSPSLTRLGMNSNAGSPENFLAARNIIRGIGVKIPNAQFVAGRVNEELATLGAPKHLRAQFPYDAGEPYEHSLWYYILKEAEKARDGKLGVVGSYIVAFTFIRLLQKSQSWFNNKPDWTPDDEIGKGLREEDKQDDPNWSLASIIRLSGLPISAKGS